MAFLSFNSGSRRRSTPKPQTDYVKDHKPKAAAVPKEHKTHRITLADSHKEKSTVTAQSDKQKDGDLWLHCLLWFSTFVGGTLVLLSCASSWLLITFPLENRYDGPFLNLENPKVVAIINAAWGLLSTILLLFLQQLCLTALVQRVTVSKMSDHLAKHFQFLLRLRILLGALTMVVLLMGVMSVFIESAVMRGAVIMGGALTVIFWYWATREPLINNKDVEDKNEDAAISHV